MAERNPRIPHSIESLLFGNRNGKYCGYKQELISDNIGAEWKEFLICAVCKGISRKPRNWRGNTVCAMCVPGQRGDNIDKRVENKVAFLNARCPLSGEGCGWKGKLREIEQHMEECLKVRVNCQLKCGNVLERESIEQHNREICPLRIIQCIYCNQEMQAKEQNPHIGICRNHPDTEVPCPYKELGCEVIVLRKYSNTHITENMTDHHTLMLNQLNQLRDKNDQLEVGNEQHKNRNQQLERVNQQLRNRVTIIETSAIDREGEHTLERNTVAGQRKQDMKVASRRVIFVWTAIVICIIVAAIIGIPLTVTQENIIKANSEGIKSNLQQIEANSQQIESNSEQIESNSQQIAYSSEQIKTNLQLIEYLLSNASYIYKYIEERGKVLPGIEWIYNLNEIKNYSCADCLAFINIIYIMKLI